jgi:hypothetical protein
VCKGLAWEPFLAAEWLASPCNSGSLLLCTKRFVGLGIIVDKKLSKKAFGTVCSQFMEDFLLIKLHSKQRATQSHAR